MFEKGVAYEATSAASGHTFTWSGRESLAGLERPERVTAIEAGHDRWRLRKAGARSDLTLSESFARGDDLDGDGVAPLTRISWGAP